MFKSGQNKKMLQLSSLENMKKQAKKAAFQWFHDLILSLQPYKGKRFCLFAISSEFMMQITHRKAGSCQLFGEFNEKTWFIDIITDYMLYSLWF